MYIVFFYLPLFNFYIKKELLQRTKRSCIQITYATSFIVYKTLNLTIKSLTNKNKQHILNI